MLRSSWNLLNAKFSCCAASEPAAAVTRSSVKFCLMKNGCVQEFRSFSVIASSVILLCLYNSLWTIRGSVRRLALTPIYPSSLFPPLQRSVRHLTVITASCTPPMAGDGRGVTWPKWSSVLPRLISALHHHLCPSCSLSPRRSCKLSVWWLAPSVFCRAGPEDNGTEWSHAKCMRWDRTRSRRRERDRVGKLGFLLSRDKHRHVWEAAGVLVKSNAAQSTNIYKHQISL